jgi:hypothetical protein
VEALLWHYENLAAPRAMGAAARERAEANFTVAHYRDRPLRGEVKALQKKQNGMQSHGPRLTTLQFQFPTWEVLISTTSSPGAHLVADDMPKTENGAD